MRPCLPIYRAGVAASWLRYRTATAAAAWVPPLAPAEVACSSRHQDTSVFFSFSLFLFFHLFLLPGPPCQLKLQAEVSTMRKRRSVADIESSSNGEVAVLEELEDAIFQF
uniref:Uncharacterized protein n=2 Tax=Aegilops tauschii subsp. strangulata TaxID=200361 RepID=A0A453I3F3_AEGTS